MLLLGAVLVSFMWFLFVNCVMVILGCLICSFCFVVFGCCAVLRCCGCLVGLFVLGLIGVVALF